jgi:predicted alpha/beta hydrolase family esterase
MPTGPESLNEQEQENRSAPWVSLWGAMVHSFVSWPQGRSEDTLIVNPFFDSATEYSIYCIHGTADRSYAFGQIITDLLEEQEDGTYLLPKSISKIYLLAFDGRYQGASIESFAEQLQHKIIKNKDKHVILFGHSRGGLIAAHFTQNIAKDIGVTVHGVLSFCSPFHGSPLAIAPLSVISSSVAEMSSDSEFLSQLRASILANSEDDNKKYYYFAVENDSIVPGEDSFIKDNSRAIIWLQNHGHLSILTSHVAAGFVSDCLQQITARPFPVDLQIPPLRVACLEIEAEIFALNNRYHLYSSAGKLKIMNELKSYLVDMCEGHRVAHFSEAKDLGEFLGLYLDTIDATTGLSYWEIIAQQLNPTFTFFNTAPSKLFVFMENFTNTYRTVSLPEDDNCSDEQDDFYWSIV